MKSINIMGNEISIKEYNGLRVVTFKDIDNVHGRPDGTANKRFLDNRERFIEGKDYFVVSNSEIRKNHILSLSDGDYRDKALITESGYLMLVKSFTDDLAWEVQRKLVDGYFRVKNDRSALSPQTQLLYGMLDQIASVEIQAKEAKELALQAIANTTAVKEALEPITDNWRDEANKRFNRVQKASGEQFNKLRTEIYKELDRRGGFDMEQRLVNRKRRMQEEGYSRTAINNLNRMDIIADDKRAREIFTKILSEYEVRYRL